MTIHMKISRITCVSKMKLLVLIVLFMSVTAQDSHEEADSPLESMDLPNEQFIDKKGEVLFKWLPGDLVVIMEVTVSLR